MSMNQMDIEVAVESCEDHPVLGPATRFLMAFMEAVNEQSDGWPYWTPARKASSKLQELLTYNTGAWYTPCSVVEATLKDVEKTLAPIKSLVTKTEHQAKYGGAFKFDVNAAWREACSK